MEGQGPKPEEVGVNPPQPAVESSPSIAKTAEALRGLANNPAIQVQSEAIKANIDGGPPIAVNMADNEPPKTLEEAKKLSASEWSQTMDDMETDAKEKGLYFAKYGKKSEDGTDTRVIILRETVEVGDKRAAVMITPDGPMTLIVAPQPHSKLSNLMSEVRMTSKGQAQMDAEIAESWNEHGRGGGFKKQGESITVITDTRDRSLDLRNNFLGQHSNDLQMMKTEEEMKIVKDAVQKSRENRIIPEDPKIKDELQQVNNAKQIRNLINTPSPSTSSQS